MKQFIAFFLLITVQASGQLPVLYNHIFNDVHVIHSRILNQDRSIYIHVPAADTAETNTAMPVLYLLDGENHFHIVSAYVDYLRHWKVIPPVIVVGIINIDRVKDLTPVNSLTDFDGRIDSNYNTSGGNKQFLNFIQQELMPYIESTYKASSFKMLGGHSFGGLTVINCLLTRPAMFDAYIAISPSLWFGNKYVLPLAKKVLPKLQLSDKKIFYSVGNEDGHFRPDLLAFDSLIQNKHLNPLQMQYRSYPDEDHMTEPIRAYYDALRFIYKDWKPATSN